MKRTEKSTFRNTHLLVVIALLFSGASLFAQYDDEMSDAEAEYQAMRDMAAFMQYTAPYRFGDDLMPGDHVTYIMGDAESEESSTIEIEVLASDKPNHVWIHERFDGNEVKMLYDMSARKLVDLKGRDEDGVLQHPELNSDSGVDSRVTEMKQLMNMTGLGLIIPSQWEQKEQPEFVRGDFGSIECSSVTPVFEREMADKLSPAELEEAQEAMKLQFSDDMPKLLPSMAMFMFLSQEQLLGGSNAGFVEGLGFKVTSYNKTARN